MRKDHIELCLVDRKSAFCMLLVLVHHGRLPRGCFKKMAKHFDVAPETISRLWRNSRANIDFYLSNHDEYEMAIRAMDLDIKITDYPDEVFANGKKGVVGRKQVLDREALREATRLIPLNQRSTYRGLAKKLNISIDSVFRLLKKERIFRIHSSALKPTLTNLHKFWRVLHALSKIDGATVNGTRSGWKFRDMEDEVHIDEKWFFLCKEGRRYILVDSKKDPTRCTRHKKHITKVMFMCAMARPRYDHRKKCMWDGKIGIWPIGHWSLAIIDSCNRPAGTPEWNNDGVDSKKYFELLTENIVPAVIAKWPRGQWEDPNFSVRIQQDGAPGHTQRDVNAQFRGFVTGLAEVNMVPHENKILLDTQPAVSGH